MNNSFCVLPWVNLSVDINGNVQPCCISSDFIKKENGENYNLGYDSLEEIYNSKHFEELRNKMLQGTPIEGCSTCYKIEKNGAISNRKFYNASWFNEYTKHKFEKLNNIDTIEYFDIRFGNLCNLNCKSCTPKNSSQLTKEISNLDTKIKNFIGLSPYFDSNQWYKTDIFRNNLRNQFQNIRLLYIAGGEPSINEANILFLQELVDLGFSKNITLKVSTNFTNTNTKFFDLIKSFKKILLFASIDGFEKIQEYLRYPSSWDQIDKNFKKILNTMDIIPTPVIQIGNLNKITDLFEYFENFNRQAEKPIVNIQPIILNNPNHLNFLYLPTLYKIECWNKIDYWVNNKCKYQGSLFYDKINLIRKICFTEVEYKPTLKKFFEFNDIFDEKRLFFLKDVNPELYKLRHTV